MQIIHLVLGKADPESMNGVNKVVHHLATHQHALGSKVQIWGITPSPGRAPKVSRDFQTLLFPKNKYRFLLPSLLKTALCKMDAVNTVVHMHGGFIPEWWAVSRLLKQLNIPYVFTAHGSYNTIAMQRSSIQKSIYFRLFESALLKNSNLLHCIGASELEATESILQGLNLALLPNGAPAADHLFGPPDNDVPVFGFIGRLDAHTKGLDLLLDGFALYVRRNLPGRLCLIGDGQDREMLEQRAAALGIQDRIEFAGPVFSNEKTERLANMDAFFHPSRNEGMPTAVLEASALGIPLVVSEETNTAGYVRSYDAGITLAENTAEHIALAMHSICQMRTQHNQLRQIRLNVLQMREQEFDWNVIAAKMVELYGRYAA